MSTATKPTVPEAIDLLESYLVDGHYTKPSVVAEAIRITLDELTRVQAELQKAAGEIVVLREQVKGKLDDWERVCKDKTCRYPLTSSDDICPHCGIHNPKL